MDIPSEINYFLMRDRSSFEISNRHSYDRLMEQNIFSGGWVGGIKDQLNID